ncbi:MAG: DASS family sodium-coupled anion symporter, partial [Negativicutes bacterium]|nr:DASS family sodium-coupled anion symporter [Negativicutes bacterium]
MSKDKLIKLGVLIALVAGFWYVTPPDGLSVNAWRMFLIYAAAILGLVLKPFPEPVILLGAVAATALIFNDPKGALAGYASTTTWLVFAAFTLSAAFVNTGLGKRIAYLLIGKLGHTTLGLGYVTAFLDLAVAPATPSNTARAGGIVFPIMNSVAVALGSQPGDTAKKVGSYLMVNTYMVTKVTSFMFVTAMAPNALAGDYMKKIMDVSLDWMFWAKALVVPGFLLLLIIPLVVYLMDPPELKKVDNKKIAEDGLRELGPMSTKEKFLVALFILALLGWMMPSVLKEFFGITKFMGVKIAMNATSVAVGIMALTFITGVMSWDELLKNKSGWSTLIWFGGIVGLSDVLTKMKFFSWLAVVMKSYMNFGDNATLALWVIVFASVAVRYLFASGTAYVAAMLPVFL